MMEDTKQFGQSRGRFPQQHAEVASSRSTLSNERGIFVITSGLILVLLFVFTALGVEVGRWYVARAELSKAVDAASLIGAKNISNPYLDDAGYSSGKLGTQELMEAVANANFSTGFMGTSAPSWNAVVDPGDTGEGKVTIEGDTWVSNQLARVLELTHGVEHGKYESQYVAANGAAQQRAVEVMMVLDRSGSMSWEDGNGDIPMTKLKEAASAFLDNFESTQDNDKFGLVSFALTATMDHQMAHDFVDPMKTAIQNMVATGKTNSEDGIDLADSEETGVGGFPEGFSDQTVVSGDQKVQQFMIFFSDGNPTAFRFRPSEPDTWFKRNGVTYDDGIVGYGTNTNTKLYNANGSSMGVYQYQTGDGLPSGGGTACSSQSWSSQGYDPHNTKWAILEHDDFGKHIYSGTSGLSVDACNVNRTTMKNYVIAVGKAMAVAHAQEIKDKGIKIYTVGLGSNIDRDFLSEVASGPSFEYPAPGENDISASDLNELFQKIATNIKLRLVQ